MNILPKSEEGRFWDKVDVGHPLGCWEWTAGIQPNGYGKFRVGSRTDGTRRQALAHRWAYESFYGPLPEDSKGRKRVRELDHQCRNRRCVNPDHLELVTRQENQRRGQGFPGENARKTRCPQGHEYTEENTYRYPDGRRECRVCHRRQGRARRQRMIRS